MRALAWILLGLVIGSFATLSAVNALRAQTAVPRSVMTLLGYHKAELGAELKGELCGESARQHIRAFAVLSRDITPAFMPLGDSEELFARYAKGLQDAADAALTVEGEQCSAWAEPVARIMDACKACHRDFK